MKEKARVILEAIIRQLEGLLVVEPGGWIRQIQEIDPDDEESIVEARVHMAVIAADRGGVVSAAMAMLGGKNILTPSLTTKGWAFWRSPLVAKEEKKAIEAAVMRWVKAQTATKELKALPPSDTIKQQHANLGVVASIFERQDSSIRRLCADLREIRDKG